MLRRCKCAALMQSSAALRRSRAALGGRALPACRALAAIAGPQEGVGESELSNLRRAVQNHKDLHEDATRALDSRVQDLEQVAPRPDACESNNAPSTRQLEERVDHVVAMLDDISTVAAPATISKQPNTLKTEVQQLHQLPNKDGNTIPAPFMDDGVEVVNLRDYVAKIDREFKTQRYDDIDVPLLYIRIQIGKATCEANINMHNFSSFSKKALDLEAKIGHGQTPTTDGRKKSLPPNWKAKGRIMFVDNDGSTIELDDDFQSGVGSEAGSVEASGGGVVVVVAQKAAFYNYYKQNPEEGMHLVYVSAAGEPVKMPPEIEGVVAKYLDLFEEPTGVVEREVVHAIKIIPGSSIPKGRIYRMSRGELDELHRQLKELVEKGWIRPSVSPYGSPVLFVPKKGGTLRMCIDYRGLNAITVKNREPLPRIDDLLDRVQGCRYFSEIDLKSRYHQIAIRPEDQHKTAFQTRYGLYEFVVMPFGLCNAPGTFQHAMNRIFHDYLDKFVIVYLNDILIFSRTIEEHVAHLDKVLSLLRQHKFKINGEKCHFGRTRILYLGHEVFAEGLKPDDVKVANVRHWPRPQSVTEMRSFLGMTVYYHNFVKNYSIMAAPLTNLTRLDTPWEWTDKCAAAFKHLKHALTHHEVLELPDPDKPFIVTTDASQYGIGVVLAQLEGPKLWPVEYMSKKMPSQKLAKSTYEKELYVIYKALTHWRHYLLGSKTLWGVSPPIAGALPELRRSSGGRELRAKRTSVGSFWASKRQNEEIEAFGTGKPGKSVGGGGSFQSSTGSPANSSSCTLSIDRRQFRNEVGDLDVVDTDEDTDAVALTSGWISVTPVGLLSTLPGGLPDAVSRYINEAEKKPFRAPETSTEKVAVAEKSYRTVVCHGDQCVMVKRQNDNQAKLGLELNKLLAGKVVTHRAPSSSLQLS
ncbi:hypothetical protein CBR_g45827 [Chara braunii]|uniref:Reverse transcriptase domain-containing protein n=1 Tax=Chara braunii TaxID=69332 RepID=A0A388LZJ2_CHABU|nr:hypothetical protein CBR_g45827 [Chara braunii]|eukprot:GBG87673.1 hypothetical protein CBR_g45827 [Chara braunii]